ncbi:MAG: 30S ribosomal protein S1 [Candidatus Nealsonbacteria bacterium CG23_combo_of_CG06-09_8_20_14_all_37_18]|uniref:30S ribosomal protein S1 n=1 Tax=Candidatus Nealsonbacteria bacterium CG23_combo_of_CG06-09_8_20_14_all_37_18 TaxID=1974720 RepID=A0A2G9YY76_9BACT|nr:MAG: 30S ribosomal protein S1 [Candidatus Nealsonbacteria bacterium CG23_combo_of_CG06-09_8_20_14_all_37_18]
MKDLLEKNNLIKPAQIGKIVEGKIIGEARSAVFLDLGPIGTGIIYGREFQEAKEEIKNLKIGNTLFAKIIDLENEEGYIELSLSQASDELTWEKLKQQKDKDEILKVKILGANRGGLLAEVFGVPAFLPVSQLLSEHYPRVEKGDVSKIVRELQKFVGKEMEVKVFDLDPRQGKLILSEKAKENEKIKEILKNYKVGDVVEGEITGITNFGVFMKFAEKNLEGLIHISELDWQLIEDPADVVKVGQVVKAKIISISDNKVSLSLKALKEDPWQNIEKEFKKGDAVEGKVTKFNPFGAFIQITPKIQGLCHISEFGTKSKMEEALKIDEKYKFQILSIDPVEHRMSLKLVESKRD